MKPPRLYRRLASGHKFGFVSGGRISLHAAADHLLLRSSTVFMENYHRFYFADIEAITVRQTTRGIFWNVALGLGLFVCLAVIRVKPGLHWFSGIFAGIFALLLILNISLGTTCVTQLQTRVQTRALPIRRVRKALRVVDRLFQNIAAAQAQIALAAPLETQVQPLAPVIQPPRSSVPPPLPGEKPVTRGRWLHAAVFAILALSGAVAIWAGLQPSAPLRYAACAALLANLPVGIVVLVLQRRYRLPARPGVFVWISVIGHSIVLPIAYFVFSTIHTVQTTRKDGPPPNPFATQVVPLGAFGDLPGFNAMLWICGAFCAAVALLGCFAILTQRGRMEAAGAA
ncbi:MAG TPA: hypothetical protein VNP98_03455 [Chthoniobacterales bacterium]|nr:hypothetical protein [Chthoniobacterales bacterium]